MGRDGTAIAPKSHAYEKRKPIRNKISSLRRAGRAHHTRTSCWTVRGPLNLCIGFSLVVIPVLTAFFLHTHPLALAILGALNLIAHVRHFFIDASRDTLDASSLSKRHPRTMLREMRRTSRGALQAAAGHHHGDGAFLN